MPMSRTSKTGSKRDPGTGTLKQLPSGKYRYVAMVSGKTVAGPSKATPEEAFAALRSKLRENAASAGRESFTTFARAWLKGRKARLSPTTCETYEFWLKSIEADALGKLQILKITEKDLRAWRDRQPHKHTTIRKRLAWIHQMLRAAGNDAHIDPPQLKHHERRPLSPREQDVLKKRIKDADPRIRLAVHLCWEMGLRRSEACGLRHEDRDGDGVWIRRVAVATAGTVHVRERAKTAKSHGWIPLPASLKRVIGKGKGFVLGGAEPMNPKTLSWHMRKLAEGTALANVPHMGLHALRRTYGMMLLEEGVDLVTAAELMRHDASMLLGEYARSREDRSMRTSRRGLGCPVR